MLSKRTIWIAGISIGVILVATSVLLGVFLGIYSPKTEFTEIIILGDEDIAKYDLPGNGSISNPFKIEDYSSLTEIRIEKVSFSFVIKGCRIQGEGITIKDIDVPLFEINDNYVSVSQDFGLRLTNVVGIGIINNTIVSCQHGGVIVSNGSYCMFQLNIIESNLYKGVFIEESFQIDLWDNHIFGNNYQSNEPYMPHYEGMGLHIENSEQISLWKNYISFHYTCDVQITETDDILIHNNEITNTCFDDSSNCTFKDNLAVMVDIHDCDTAVVDSNQFISPTYSTMSCRIYAYENCSIENNVFTNVSLVITIPSDFVFSNNNFNSCFLKVTGVYDLYSNPIIGNNTLNDEKLELIVNEDDSIINGEECNQIIIYLSSNVTVSGLGENIIEYGVYLEMCDNILLENLRCTNPLEDDAIYMQHCNTIHFNNITCFNSSFGMFMDDTHNTIINNSRFFGSDMSGMEVGYTSNITITNCEFAFNDYYGLFIIDSDLINIENNQFHSNYIPSNPNQFGTGLLIGDTTNVNIGSNVFNNELTGLFLSASNFAYIYNNSFSCKKYGVYIYTSYGTSFISNKFYGCGLYFSSTDYFLQYYDSYDFIDNEINGKPIGFFVDLNNTVFTNSSYSQLFFINCFNVTIKDVEISNCSFGVLVLGCEEITLRNITATYCYDGILVINSNFTTITECNLLYNENDGIDVRESNNVTISFNTCNYNTDGHGFDRGITCSYSTDLTVVNNTCNYNEVGIEMGLTTQFTIANNTCNYNIGAGIDLGLIFGNALVANNTCNYNAEGLYCIWSEYVNISGNILYMNTQYGARIWGCHDLHLSYNLFQENGLYGVYITNDDDNVSNVISYNTFWENGNEYIEAMDQNENNIWNYNFWSDYSGSGIYEVGGYDAYDYYPLLIPPVPPII